MPRVAALEITDADLKVILATWAKGQPIQIERAISVDLSDLGKDQNGIATRLSRVRDKLKAAENLPQCDAGILLPKQYCVARTVKLPTSSPDEVAGMVQFEAEKHIPFNREQHVISHELLAIGGVEGSDVILAATEEAVARQGAEYIAAGGFEPVFAGVSSLALVHGFLAQSTPEGTRDPVVLLQIGQIHTDISIVHKGRLVATRAVMYGLSTLRNLLMEGSTPFDKVDKDVHEKLLEEMKSFGVPVAPGRRVSHEQIMRLNLNEPEALMFDMESEDEEEAVELGTFTDVGHIVRGWMHKLAGQVRRTCEFAAREAMLPPPVRLHICGEGAMIRGMDAHLAGELGIEVSVFNPLAKLAPAPTLPKAEMERLVEFASLYGCLLILQEKADLRKAAPQRINLLPADVVARYEAQERNVLLTVSATLVLIGAILGFLLWDANNRYAMALAKSHEESIAVMEPRVKELKEKERKVRIIQRLRSDRSSAMQVLDTLAAYDQLGSEPRGGRLTYREVKYVAEDSVTISGMTFSIPDLTRFVDYLRAEKVGGKPLFAAVNVKDQKQTELSGRSGILYEFTVLAQFASDGKKRR